MILWNVKAGVISVLKLFENAVVLCDGLHSMYFVKAYFGGIVGNSDGSVWMASCDFVRYHADNVWDELLVSCI